VIYQIIVLSLLLGAILLIFKNTMTNLEERGISSGFKFLSNEAGFGMSEALPIPMPHGTFLAFIFTFMAGLVVAFLLNRMQAARGKTIGDSTFLVLTVIFFLFVIPGSILYFMGDRIVSSTYTETSSYAMGLVTGLLNTLKVSFLGCVLATLLGLVIGISRLSTNWLVSHLAAAFIETIRNIPLLLQLFFWYHAVLMALPGVQDSIKLASVVILNNRGVYLPDPEGTASFGLFTVAIFLALVAIYFRVRHVNQIRDRTGEQLPVLMPSLAVLVGLPALVWIIFGSPFTLSYPVLGGFNFSGGLWLSPEFAAMLFGLVIYTSAFIAEIVRSGIEAISKGQREAAMSLGLRPGHTMRLVILPQAMRVIIPPLTSQYLNLTKNSSLGVAIAYPELVSVGGTILNQSGQAIEIIFITMCIYLTFSLLISMFMNWYNAKNKLVER